MAEAAIKKNCSIAISPQGLTDVDEIWHILTQISPLQGQIVKISNFSKTKMAAAAILKKNHKNCDITATN